MKQQVGVVLVAVILIALGYSAFYTIKSGTVGVVATFGEFSEDVSLPGLHFKFPLVQRVYVFDVKLQTANYKGKQDQGSRKGLYVKPYIEVLDSKNLPIGIELSVQFTPIREQANVILEKYGNNYYEKLINPLVRNVVRDVVGGYVAEDIANKRGEIGKQIIVMLDKSFEKTPFTLNNVALRNIKLPQIVLKKIEEVQLAKQEEQRLGMVEKQARKEQEIKTIKANTKLIEVTTQAKAEAEKKRIGADAKAYQIEKEAEAVASANTMIARSISQPLIDYKAIERWSGNYPSTLLGGDKGIMLRLPGVAGTPK